jgi:RNA polymerase sigma-70 factor (ECF subfamily)
MSLAESETVRRISFDHKGRSPAPAWRRYDNSPVVFEDLAMPLFDSLYNFAYWLTQNREDAEDLVQETYVKALRGFKSFQLGSNFRAWIFQILRNTFLSSRSRLELRMTVPLSSEENSPVLPVTSNTAELLLIERSDLHSVRCAIEQLPAVFREAILLCDVEEMTYQDIAETLSIPIGTVMSRIARARRAVRDALSKTSASILRGPTETEMAAEVE